MIACAAGELDAKWPQPFPVDAPLTWRTPGTQSAPKKQIVFGDAGHYR